MLHANSGTLTDLFSTGKAGMPVVVSTPGGELLLAKDAVGLFVGRDGRPTRQPSLTWGDVPAAAAAAPPYVVALLPRHVEVRSLC